MTSETEFIENVLKAFKNIIKEIEKGSVEHDIRPRFVKYFVEPVLGYTGSNYRYEKKRTDITIFDKNDFAVIKVETKKPDENIEKPEHEEQAFKYEEETTRFIGLTNFLQFKLWEVKKTGSELRINLDFSKILEQRKPIENLSSEEKSQILFLNNLTKETLFDPSKYEKFDETYARIDITKDIGFRKLLDRLNFIANDLLLDYTRRAFGEYKEGFGKYQAELNKAERESKNNKGNHELNHGIAKYKQKLEEKYSKYKTFSGYELWKEYSGKEDVEDDKVKEIFCKETIYVLLNKLLFIRICEDKEFLKQNISNGGIEQLRTFLKERVGKDEINKEILEFAYKSAKGLYSHFYEVGILDWFRTGDGELNKLLNSVLWILNQFDFTHVDRDILGNLYEKYLPSGERKRLGEFYTPTEVIDYILTSVGYTYSYDIETKDLLDPACGSGGFLVRASRRLISRYLMKFRKTDKRELRDPKKWKDIVSRLSPDEAKIILESLQEHIYGLDINPFACHIAEMNLLFQIIDLYQKVREKYPDYKLKRFKIYRTDSLEKPTQKQIWDYSHQAFLEEQEEIDAIKNKKFDFVVGNPPYVREQMLDVKTREYLKNEYKTTIGKFDIYIPFIERGIDWIKENSKLGYINPNLFLNREYGKELRKLLLENSVLQVIDFGDSGVFKDVTNYPCILVVQKKKLDGNKIKTIIVYQPKDYLLYDIQKKFYQKEFKDDFFALFEVAQDKLSDANWILKPENVLRLMKRLDKSINTKLSSITDTIHQGLITGENSVFFINESIAKSERLEQSLLKKVPKGRNVRKYRIDWLNRWLIYPQKEDGSPYSESEFKNKYPNTYRYLHSFEEKLSKRKYYGKSVKQLHGSWFPLIHAKPKDAFETIKIVTPNLSKENNFALDKENYFFDHDTY
ncbi:MAG: N-6 DNA methylase, partial [Candidatus Aenigmarchaeota archaeon]|nr:N-6 DNA methylase [Candidatus Aenigmarchaeota archaeon]